MIEDVVGRQEGHPACFVGDGDLTGALHVL